LFGIVRSTSLKELGVATQDQLSTGIFLLNSQMVGLLLGGILWGVLGDKKGRRTVLFGSIILYSLANLLNAAVTSIPAYAAARFLAGLGLAGELGAAVTLVAESLPTQYRGFGTTLVASFGLLGAIAASIVGEWVDWRAAYVIGGMLGLTLLFLRFGLKESVLFSRLESQPVSRGSLGLFFKSPSLGLKLLKCVAVGVPVYFVVGILITFSPEFGAVLKTQGVVVAGRSILFSYIGAAVGDLLSGLLSQYFKNRKKVISFSLWLNLIFIFAFLGLKNLSLPQFYGLCTLLGLTTGYWSVLITTACEQFGTNVRATVTTIVPNFVRASVVPLSLLFRSLKGTFGMIESTVAVAITVTLIAQLSVWRLKESFADELDFVEI
jgi:putative MFS transporter